MKHGILIFTALLMVSCSKASKTGEKTGKALLYSDVFVAVDCKIDSVSIFIDHEYKGKLTNSFLPLSRPPGVGDPNTLVSDLSVGKHTYIAKVSGCNAGQWSGVFFVEESSCKRINLRAYTLKP